MLLKDDGLFLAQATRVEVSFCWKHTKASRKLLAPERKTRVCLLFHRRRPSDASATSDCDGAWLSSPGTNCSNGQKRSGACQHSFAGLAPHHFRGCGSARILEDGSLDLSGCSASVSQRKRSHALVGFSRKSGGTEVVC
jgi:hypothetical protein